MGKISMGCGEAAGGKESSWPRSPTGILAARVRVPPSSHPLPVPVQGRVPKPAAWVRDMNRAGKVSIPAGVISAPFEKALARLILAEGGCVALAASRLWAGWRPMQCCNLFSYAQLGFIGAHGIEARTMTTVIRVCGCWRRVRYSPNQPFLQGAERVGEAQGWIGSAPGGRVQLCQDDRGWPCPSLLSMDRRVSYIYVLLAPPFSTAFPSRLPEFFASGSKTSPAVEAGDLRPGF